MRTLLMSTVAALFVAGTAYAEDVKVLIDADEDGQVTVEEWDASRADVTFGDWDANNDGFLSSDEYAAHLEMQENADNFGAWDEYYGGWDADGDGMLSVDEYNAGLWQAYDADDDGMWSQDETMAWEGNEMNYDATRSGGQVSGDAEGAEAGASSGGDASGQGAGGGAATQ